MIRQLTGLQRCFVVLIVCLSLLPLSTSAQGNSDAAHACQGDGYLTLVGTNGETFANVGQCVRFAAQGGQFADGTDALEGTIVIPAGFSATLSNQVLSACNALSYGYSLNGGPMVELRRKSQTGCTGGDTFFFDSVTIGTVGVDSVLILYLVDETCGYTYDSDGYHAKVVETAPVYEVDIADGGDGCWRAAGGYTLSGDGNLSLTVTVHE